MPSILQALSKYEEKSDKQVRDDWRNHRCFLNNGDKIFQSECVDSGSDGLLVYLWGDSHAATLYSGLRDIQKSYPFRIAQFTRTSCPPWKNDPTCPESYSENIARIKSLNPNIVLLHAAWAKSTYENYNSLNDTLKELIGLGVPKIVVLGATPEWNAPLPTTLYNMYLTNHFAKLPERTNFGLSKNIWERDEAIKLIAEQNPRVKFVSVKDILCNIDGCLTLINGEPTTYDTGHLSPPASMLVARSLMAEAFKSGLK